MYQTKDEELLKVLNKYPHIGCSVIHTTNQEIDYYIVDGKENVELNIPTSFDTIYRIASVSKIEIAIGIMKLKEMNKLDIYEDISKYLGFEVRNPNYPNHIITLELLMTQTSSISDLGDEVLHKGYDGVNGYIKDYVSLKDILSNKASIYYSEKVFLNKEPGTYWNYSNLGCGICACIIEKVSGMLYDDFLQEYIFKPLNIDGTYFYKKVKNKTNVASLYEYDSKSDEKQNKFYLERNQESFFNNAYDEFPLGNNFRGPAGGLFISGKNLSIIMMMLMNNGIYHNVRVLNEETVLEMKKIHWQGTSYDPEYKKKGLQLLLLDGYSKETLMGHCGCAYGLRSFMLFNNKHGYIFLCNGANFGSCGDHFTKMIEDVLKYLIAKFE